MSLINCPECGHQVSDRAKTCPNCGFPIENIGNICLAGEFICYGEYPQSFADKNLWSTLDMKTPDNHGFVEHLGRRYKKIDWNELGVPDGEVLWFNVEPIKWKVLKRDGDKLLLISDKVIDQHLWEKIDWELRRDFEREGLPTPNQYINTNYFDSELRRWLNNEFLLSAFPDGGTLLNKLNGDKVTILSKEELSDPMLGLSSNELRSGSGTPYLEGLEGWNSYWTSSISANGYSIKGTWTVNDDGELQLCPINGDDGVRPVICITAPQEFLDKSLGLHK